MEITLSGKTALFVMRSLRASRTAPGAWGKRVDLIPPDPAPSMRFTKKLFDMPAIGFALSSEEPLSICVAVPDKASRLRMKGARNIIYGSAQSLPAHPFIEVAQGLAISCPELIFLEMAAKMTMERLVMLGHELCGSFSRNPHDPRNGNVMLWCPPATSSGRIEEFIRATKWNAQAERALRALSFVSDGAWSPTESIIATMVNLPYEEFGYGLGRCELNKKVDTSVELANAIGKNDRRPDLLFKDAPVGLNYDGAVHLDLDKIAQAAINLERSPEEAAAQQTLDAVIAEVRAKAVDDIRRNRELAAAGYIVFPVTKEDLYENGGLDTVMLQAMKTIENLTGKNLSEQKRLLGIRFCREKRQDIIWSLLPGTHAHARKRARETGGPRIIEVQIGF